MVIGTFQASWIQLDKVEESQTGVATYHVKLLAFGVIVERRLMMMRLLKFECWWLIVHFDETLLDDFETKLELEIPSNQLSEQVLLVQKHLLRNKQKEILKT